MDKFPLNIGKCGGLTIHGEFNLAKVIDNSNN